MRHWKLGLATVCALAIGVLAYCLIPGGGDGVASAQARTFTAADHSFSVAYPPGWAATPLGRSAGVIERSDHRGLVLVRERPALHGKLSTLVKGLPTELRKRFPDFHPLGASVARLTTGPAVVYTFARTKSASVQSIVVAPAPALHRSFTLEVAAPAKAHDAVREAGAIVRSLTAR